MTPQDEGRQPAAPAAVVFDLDGVLVDSEPIWAAVRERYTGLHGGHWYDGAEERMKGMSSLEWARFLHDEVGVARPTDEIATEVAGDVATVYRKRLPLLPSAVDTVLALASRWPLGLASSSNRPLIELVLQLAGLAGAFGVVVSSEEVASGKPAPDVYREAARRLGVAPGRCLAVEDSSNGIRSALAAAMIVVAVPRAAAPVPPSVLAQCAAVLDGLGELTPARAEQLLSARPRPA
jgi:HAD superfamily hydrolase (TIGR01509 family)